MLDQRSFGGRRVTPTLPVKANTPSLGGSRQSPRKRRLQSGNSNRPGTGTRAQRRAAAAEKSGSSRAGGTFGDRTSTAPSTRASTSSPTLSRTPSSSRGRRRQTPQEASSIPSRPAVTGRPTSTASTSNRSGASGADYAAAANGGQQAGRSPRPNRLDRWNEGRAMFTHSHRTRKAGREERRKKREMKRRAKKVLMAAKASNAFKERGDTAAGRRHDQQYWKNTEFAMKVLKDRMRVLHMVRSSSNIWLLYSYIYTV